RGYLLANNLINYNAVHKRTYYIYTFLERFHCFSSDQCHIPFVPLVFLCLQCFSSFSMHLQDVFSNVLSLFNYPLLTRATLLPCTLLFVFLFLLCFSSFSMHLQDVFPNVLPLLNYPLATRATLLQGPLLSVEPYQESVESQHQKNVLNQLHHQIVPYVLDTFLMVDTYL